MTCGAASPSDPYFFYHIKSSKEEQARKEREERRASKFAIKDKRRHFHDLVQSGKQLTAGPVLSKQIRAYDHIPRMTEDEMAYFQDWDFLAFFLVEIAGSDRDNESST